MQKQQRLIVGIVLAILLIIFSLLNSQEVAVNFFGAAFHWPLILVLVGTLLIGVLVTLLVTGFRTTKSDKEVEELRKQVQNLKESREVDIAAAKQAAEQAAGAEIARLKAQLQRLEAPKEDNKTD